MLRAAMTKLCGRERVERCWCEESDKGGLRAHQVSSPGDCDAASTSTKPRVRTPGTLYVRLMWRLSDVELYCVST